MGLECFWDTEIPPGQTWSYYIEGKLSVCKAVIVLWSAHSTGSQWVREEARIGRDKGKLIPAMLDNSPAPYGFGEVQAANLAEWRGQPNHPDWVRFAGAVATAVRGANAAPAQAAAAPPQPAVPPPPQFAAQPTTQASQSPAADSASPLASADFGPFPAPEGLNSAISAVIDEVFTGSLGPVAIGFRLESITIADGIMTLTGRIK